MVLLSEKQPSILIEFRAGKFAVCKTSNKFSAMAIDQCHEQNNAIIKESGGAIGLTNNPGALRCWIVAGLEVARMVTEFESYTADNNNGDSINSHHEQHPGVQASLLNDVKSLIAVFIEMGNPFLEKGQDLVVLDTKDIMNISVGETVRKAEALGEEQYKKFVEERLVKCEKPITDILSKNKLPLFSRPSVKCPSRQKVWIATT